MGQLNIAKIKLQDGIWHGIVTGSDNEQPALIVTHQERVVSGVRLEALPKEGGWLLQIPVPTGAIADGVQTLLIKDANSGDLLDSFALIAGEALAEDTRAEVDLLRAELDMLKRAFRRHCRDTP